MDKKHLTDHAYYCCDSEGIYHEEIDSWSDFLKHFGNMDPNLNLFFRFDIEHLTDEDGKPTRRSVLRLYTVQQRKPDRRASLSIRVTESDMPSVYEWLRGKWEHLKALWAPVSLEVSHENH